MQKKFLYTLLISTSVLSCIGLNSAYAAVAPSNGWYNPQPNEWYYYKNNEPVTGLYTPEKGHTYYFNESGNNLGLMYTGWKQIGNDWYYFDENNKEGSTGSQHRGWLFRESEAQYYYFDNTGKMVTGLYSTDKNHTYYFGTGENGKDDLGKLYSGWVLIGNDWYYFNVTKEDGDYNAAHSGWLTYKKTDTPLHYPKYYFNNEYKMVTGWLELGPKEKYYFYESGSNLGQMATGTVNINGTNYTFNDDGRLKK